MTRKAAGNRRRPQEIDSRNPLEMGKGGHSTKKWGTRDFLQENRKTTTGRGGQTSKKKKTPAEKTKKKKKNGTKFALPPGSHGVPREVG